jgi:hypothetical protein
VLGDNVTYTFVGQPDEGRPTAVRLDYTTYPDAAHLSDEALRATGSRRPAFTRPAGSSKPPQAPCADAERACRPRVHDTSAPLPARSKTARRAGRALQRP